MSIYIRLIYKYIKRTNAEQVMSTLVIYNGLKISKVLIMTKAKKNNKLKNNKLIQKQKKYNQKQNQLCQPWS